MVSKYILTDSKRTVFLQKVMPTLFFGSLIWLISEIFFGEIFITISLPMDFSVIYLIMVIFNSILFIIYYIVSRKGKNLAGIIAYFLFAFTAGILSVPIFIWIEEFSFYVHLFVGLALGGTVLVLIIGLILREKFIAVGYIWHYILLLVLGVCLLLILFIFIFQITNWIVILISAIVIMCVVLIITLYGTTMTNKIKSEFWGFTVFRILSFLLMFVFIIFIVVIIIIFVIIGGEAFGGFDGGLATGGKKKKKKFVEDKEI